MNSSEEDLTILDESGSDNTKEESSGVILESSAETDDEPSILKTKRKKPAMRIESDESENSDDDDKDENIINESTDESAKENSLEQHIEKWESDDEPITLKTSPEINNASCEESPVGDEISDSKKVEGRPSQWAEDDILSSTRIHNRLSTLPSPDNKNPLKTPKKDFHLNTDLKESFLTPRQTKIVSSDEESDNESDIEQQISTKIENTTNSSHEKNDSDGLEHNFADVMGKLKQADPDIIDVSSDEEEPSSILLKPKSKATSRQTTLDNYTKPLQEIPQNNNIQPTTSTTTTVTQVEYNSQEERVARLEDALFKANNVLKTINLSALPDKGDLLLKRHNRLNIDLKKEKEILGRMVVNSDNSPKDLLTKDKILSSWEDMQKATDLVQPRTQGERALATLNNQKALTMELLSQLHSSLKTCPDENTFADDPKGLKVELMPHQKRALAWLMFRETQKPAGGILADDMGLGKTLTMISLVLKQRESGADENEDDEFDARTGKYRGKTLVVCPASLVNQWEGEILRMTRRGLLDIEVYHGPKREKKPKKLAKRDFVLTTYSIIQNEFDKNGTVFGVKWHRIILDEAHQIRNYKSRTANAVCHLSGRKRWALTGTPVHNKEEDMYGLLKFLRCTPFDDLAIWRRWIANKNTGGQNRLSAVISSLLLRRTKADLFAAGNLKCLPERKWQLITVNLDKMETDIYHKVLVFSRTLFAQFLHQRAEKKDEQYPTASSAEYFKMHRKLIKINGMKEIKQHHILVLLLRLRQICCHPCLITSMLEKNDLNIDGDDESEESEELNILEQLSRLDLEDDHYDPAVGLTEEPVGLAEASRGILNPSHPVFSTERCSSKIKIVLQVLKEKVLSTTDDKAIIVSQWTSLLQLIAQHLKNDGVHFNELNGTVPVHKRVHLVDDFNNPKHPVKVMLLSLTAGGVGLNLIGGNHLFLIDLHWNPQLEMQAQDRIYRVGQKKDVNVYKFMTVETIEERIKKLQESKLALADSMLTGSKIKSAKLTLSDLKMLFNM